MKMAAIYDLLDHEYMKKDFFLSKLMTIPDKKFLREFFAILYFVGSGINETLRLQYKDFSERPRMFYIKFPNRLLKFSKAKYPELSRHVHDLIICGHYFQEALPFRRLYKPYGKILQAYNARRVCERYFNLPLKFFRKNKYYALRLFSGWSLKKINAYMGIE